LYFKHFYDSDLAQSAYLIGCQSTGEAVVIDAHRDIQMFLDDAKAHNLKIVAALETHMHADYLSGVREIAHATGAKIYLSDEGNQDWKYGYQGQKMLDGDKLNIGNIVIEFVHTPGHTLEHMSYLITDTATANKPGFFLTGDFVFVGDIGRPDLLDEAAGAKDTRFTGARLLFESLQNKFLNLPDYIQVWPGHGAGSACGKALGAVASTTIGYERNFAWWMRYIHDNDYQGFEDALLSDQPDAPIYFARMKIQNKAGPAILGELKPLKEMNAAEIREKIGKEILFIDTRKFEDTGEYVVTGAYNVPWGGKFLTYASWIIDSLKDKRDIVLLAKNINEADKMRRMLIHVGIDNVIGFISSLSGLKKEKTERITADELARLDKPYILDMRTKVEYHNGHIPRAKQMHVGRLIWNLDKLPKDKTIVSYCIVGVSSLVGSSALRASGFRVVELDGGFSAWLNQNLPVESG